MNGGDKILNRIKSDCDEVVSKILAEADENAAQIISQAEIQAENTSKDILNKTDLKVKQIEKSSKSRCELEIRNSILRQRRIEIDKTVSELKEYILSLDNEEYFNFIYKLAASLNVCEGEIFLNEKDLKRIPSDFIDKLADSGINASLSEKAADISGGFILKNGNIEENMAVDAVIMSKRDSLEDIISKELFK